MEKSIEIKPLMGFGSLKFGVTAAEVEQYFGPPQETETLEVEDESDVVDVWSYWDMGHSVYFERAMNGACTNFETDNEQALLFGEYPIGMNKEAIIRLMKDNGYENFEAETEDEGEEILFFSQAQLQVVFEEDTAVLVSWAVDMDDNDKVLWP